MLKGLYETNSCKYVAKTQCMFYFTGINYFFFFLQVLMKWERSLYLFARFTVSPNRIFFFPHLIDCPHYMLIWSVWMCGNVMWNRFVKPDCVIFGCSDWIPIRYVHKSGFDWQSEHCTCVRKSRPEDNHEVAIENLWNEPEDALFSTWGVVFCPPPPTRLLHVFNKFNNKLLQYCIQLY